MPSTLDADLNEAKKALASAADRAATEDIAGIERVPSFTHRVFKVSRRGQKPLILKIHRAKRDARDLQFLSRIVNQLSEAMTSCRVPRNLEAGFVNGTSYTLWEFVEGSHLPGAPAGAHASLARCLSELHHRLAHFSAAIDAPQHFQAPATACRRYFDSIDLPAIGPFALSDLRRRSIELETITPGRTFVHGDLRLANILFDSPDRVAAIIDFDEFLMADFHFDLAYLLFEIGGFPATAIDAPRMHALALEYRRCFAQYSGVGRLGPLRPWLELFLIWNISWLHANQATLPAAQQERMENWLAAAMRFVAGPQAEPFDKL